MASGAKHQDVLNRVGVGEPHRLGILGGLQQAGDERGLKLPDALGAPIYPTSPAHADRDSGAEAGRGSERADKGMSWWLLRLIGSLPLRSERALEVQATGLKSQ